MKNEAKYMMHKCIYLPNHKICQQSQHLAPKTIKPYNSFNYIFTKFINGPPLINLHINSDKTTNAPDPAEYEKIISLK